MRLLIAGVRAAAYYPDMQYDDLKTGMIVRHTGSGKLYRCMTAKPPMSPELVQHNREHGFGYNAGWYVTFVGRRNGKDFGPCRSLKMDQIEPAVEPVINTGPAF